MGLKIGDTTTFYNVASRKKVKAKIKSIKRSKGKKRATGMVGKMKLSKFIK